MGNCTPDLAYRRTARQGLDFKCSKTKRPPLVFQVRTWPRSKTFDLQDSENCIERCIDVALLDGESIDVNLKSTHQPIKQSLMQQDVLSYNIRCSISKKDRSYKIRFPVEEERKYLWSFIGNWSEIKEGSIIRMGKTKYRLAKLVHQKQLSPYKSLKNIDDSLVSNSAQANRCRICLSSSDSADDPLISPCKCSGSVKYTHMKCLSRWLFNLSPEQEYTKIRVDQYICQLCKTDITGTAQYLKMMDILLGNANNASSPYAIFEIYQKDEEQRKNYFILSFTTKQNYVFGRSSKADICDQHDNCISKYNTEMQYKQKKLIVRDCQSTHGTFMKIENEINLDASIQKVDISYRNMIIRARYNPTLDQQ